MIAHPSGPPSDDDPPELPGPLAAIIRAPVTLILLALALVFLCCAEVAARLLQPGEPRHTPRPRRAAEPSRFGDAA
jgi:hypothetical protein